MRCARWLAILLVAACGRAPTPCERACDRILVLAEADLQTLLDDADPAFRQSLRDELARARKPSTATCLKKCTAGELDTACVMAAPALETAMGCGRKP